MEKITIDKINRIISVQQAAVELSVTTGTVYKYINEGSLKAHKMGKATSNKRHWRIKVEDLQKFINGKQ